MTKRKTHEQFILEMSNVNNNIKIIGKYINAITKIECECLVCFYTWSTLPSPLVRGRSCPKCAIKSRSLKCKVLFTKNPPSNKKNSSQFIEELKIVQPYLKIMSEYKGALSKVKYECLKCGKIQEGVPNNLLRGFGCPSCKMSKGEREVERVLNLFNIRFKKQFKIDGCKLVKPLPFDFALFDCNDNLLCFIEYQGIQHFKHIKYFCDEEKFKVMQKRDFIKRNYCLDNNILLFEVSYLIKDIQQYLYECFNQHNILG